MMQDKNDDFHYNIIKSEFGNNFNYYLGVKIFIGLHMEQNRALGRKLVSFSTLIWQQSEICIIKVKYFACQNGMLLLEDFNNVKVNERCNV